MRPSTLRQPLVVVPAVLALVIVVVPLVSMMGAALFGSGAGERFGFLKPVVFDRLVNSIVLAGLTALAAVTIGAWFATAIHRRRIPGRRFLAFMALLPLLVPPHIHAVAILRVIGNTGWLSLWFIDHGYDFNVRRGFVKIGGEATIFPGAIGIMTSAFWPLAFLVVSAGLSRLDPSREEVVLPLENGERLARRIRRRALMPHLVSAFLLVFIFAIGCYPVPLLLDTPTVMQQIFFPTSNVDASTGAVVALPLVVVTILALAFASWLLGRSGRYTSGLRTEVPASLSRSSRAVSIGAWLWILVASVWPFLSLLWKAAAAPSVDFDPRNWIDAGAHIVRSISAHDSVFRFVFQRCRENLENSLWIGLAAAALFATFGTAIALFAERRRKRSGFVVEALALLPFAFPAVVVGVALNRFWGRFESIGFIDRYVYNGGAIAVLAPFTLFLPFVVRSVRASFAQASPNTIEAAELAGVARWRILWRIVLPTVRAGILSGIVLGFVLTVGELAAGMIASPGTWQSGQVRVFNMIHFSRDEEVAALCIMMALMSLVPMSVHALLSRRPLEVL